MQRSILLVGGLFTLLTVLTVFSPASQEAKKAPAAADGGEVHGSVIAHVRNPKTERINYPIYLPDITVYLKNLATSAVSPKVTTNLDGSYVIPKQASGKYHVCVEGSGYLAHCDKEIVVIKNQPVAVQPVQIRPKGGVVHGKVRLSNGRPGRYNNPFFAVDFHTTVTLTDAQGKSIPKVPKVRANVVGEFLIPGAPRADLRVRAECESAKVESAVQGRDFSPADLTLPNTSPRVLTVVAFQQGKAVRKVAPGATVEVTVDARDIDGDKLHYVWRASGSKGKFTSVDAKTVKWTVPDSQGIHFLYVLVLDGKGGHSLGRLDLPIGEKEVVFTGIVTERSGPVVPGATVSVNGKRTTTNKEGQFVVKLPQESPRYVVNISKDGYALLSKVNLEPIVGGRFRLVKAYNKVIDRPDRAVEIIEFDPERKREQLTRVIIDADSLVGQDGKAPAGALTCYLSTYNLRDADGLPGDYGAVNERGEDVTLTSYGAVDIQVKDGAGNPYNLKAGKTATVMIPVELAQLNAPGNPPPPVIPFWFYDAAKGFWRQEGTAKLEGAFYVNRAVKHFSVMNVDIAKVDAACMRIIVDPTQIQILPFDLRITIPNGTGVPTVKTRSVDALLNVIVRLPANTDITLSVLDGSGTPRPEPGMTQTVNSGAAIPGVASTTPAFPYEHCNSEAILPANPPADNGFLNFTYGEVPFTSLIEAENETVANAYYDAIDPPPGQKTTLDDWKTANGFIGSPAEDAEAIYLNDGDLGLGRWMRMKKSGPNLAYYVSNYGLAPASGSADVAAIAKLTNTPGFGLIATVAMEYSPGPTGSGAAPYTRFFVFNAAGVRVNKADLDGRGAKYVPNLCVICHGGTPPTHPAVISAGAYPRASCN